jgi:isopenicillin N synthase-like dioxygenase
MEVWSNGRLKATPHRVISADQGHYSMPFFYGCNLDARVAPLPNCISEDTPAQFEPVMYDEKLTKFLSSNYDFS